MVSEKELKVSDTLTLKIEDGLLQVYAKGQLIPLETVVDDAISLINENFSLYCRIYERHGKEFVFRDRGWLNIMPNEKLPAWFTFIKIDKKNKDIMKKLIVPLILRGNLQSLLFCYSEGFLHLLGLLEFTYFQKELMVTQLTIGVQTKDKWIFNLSFAALNSLSFGSISSQVKFKKTIHLVDHLRIKEYVGKSNLKDFLIAISENLLELYDPKLFYYSVDRLSKFFSFFGTHALEGLNRIYHHSSGELQSIAEKSLLQIQAQDDLISIDFEQNVSIDRLKELNVKEIKTLVPNNTGKVVIETAIKELIQETSKERYGDNYGIALNLFLSLSKDPQISFKEGVKTVFTKNNLEKLELLIDLETLSYLTAEECVSLLQSVPIELFMNMFIILDNRDVKIRGSLSEREYYWKRDSYYLCLEHISKFFEKAKGHIPKPIETQLLTKLAENPLDFSRNVVKFHFLENPTADDLIYLLQSPMIQGEITSNYFFFESFFNKIAQNNGLIDILLRKIVEGKDIDAVRGLIASGLLLNIQPEQFSAFLSKELYEALYIVARFRKYNEWDYEKLESITYFFKGLNRKQYNSVVESVKDLFTSQNIEGISLIVKIGLVAELHKIDLIELIKNPKFHFFKNFGRVINSKDYYGYYDYDSTSRLFTIVKKLVNKERIINILKNDNYFEFSCIISQGLLETLNNDDLENLSVASKLNLIKNLIFALDFYDESGNVHSIVWKYLDQFRVTWQELFSRALYGLFARSSPETINTLLESEITLYESLDAKSVEKLLSPSDMPNEIYTYVVEKLKEKAKHNYDLINFFLFVYKLGLEQCILKFINHFPPALRKEFGLQLDRAATYFHVSLRNDIVKIINLVRDKE